MAQRAKALTLRYTSRSGTSSTGPQTEAQVSPPKANRLFSPAIVGAAVDTSHLNALWLCMNSIMIAKKSTDAHRVL